MAKRVTVSFPGKKRVDAEIGGLLVKTDQSVKSGGDGSAPQPFDYLFISLASCAGICALEYCTNREIATEGLAVTLEATLDPTVRRYTEVTIKVTPPQGFPMEQLDELLKEADDCTVKQHILNPPRFSTIAV